MSAPKPTIVLFSEFKDIIRLTKIVNNEANIQICTPFNSPQPDYITRNIKIFYPLGLDRNDAERLTQKLSNKLTANNFATFVTDQLVYTDPETKEKVLAPKDRIILELNISHQEVNSEGP